MRSGKIIFLLLGVSVKALISLLILAIIFAIALVIGLKNGDPVTVNYLIAESEVRLSVLMAIVFGIAFVLGTGLSSLLYFKLKISHRRLTKRVSRQGKELEQLRTLPVKD